MFTSTSSRAEGVDRRSGPVAPRRPSRRRRRRWPPPRRPAPRISSTTSLRGAGGPPGPSSPAPRSLTTTFAPCRANSSACARPMPPPAPGHDHHTAVADPAHDKVPFAVIMQSFPAVRLSCPDAIHRHRTESHTVTRTHDDRRRPGRTTTHPMTRLGRTEPVGAGQNKQDKTGQGDITERRMASRTGRSGRRDRRDGTGPNRNGRQGWVSPARISAAA